MKTYKSHQEAPGKFGKQLAMIVSILCVFFFFLMILERIGVESSILSNLLGSALLLLYLFVGLFSHSINASGFFFASTALTPTQAAAARAVSALSGLLVLATIGLAQANLGVRAVIVSAICGGLLLGGLLFGAIMYRLKAVSLGDILSIPNSRLGGPPVIENWVRTLCAILIIAICTTLLVAEVRLMVQIGGPLISATPLIGTIVALIVTVICCLAGGMRAVARTQIVQYLTVLAAFTLPSLWIMIAYPVAEISISSSNNVFAAALNGEILPTNSSLTIAELAVLFVCLLAGISALPHLLSVYPALDAPEKTKRTSIWSMIFVGLAVALISVCGINLGLGNARAAATAQSSNAISIPPGLLIGLVKVGIVAALISTMSGALLAIGNVAGNDLYRKLIAPTATDTQMVFVSRLTLLIAAFVAGFATYWLEPEPFTLVVALVALSMAGLFPAMILRVFWHRCSAAGILAAMLVGPAVGIVIALVSLASNNDPTVETYTRVFSSAGVSGAIAAFTVAVAVVFLTSKLQSRSKQIVG